MTVLAGLVILMSIQNRCFGQYQKLAQTGFQFLSVISDAKAASMGGSVNSLEMGSASLFFNPAGMAGLNGSAEVSVSLNNWIADIRHMQFSAAVNLHNLGVIGASIQVVNYGEILETIVDPNPNSTDGYIDIGTFSPNAYCVGIGYAKQLNEQFSIGGQVKIAQQDLGDGIVPVSLDMTDSSTTIESFKKNPIAFDFGTLFKTGIKSLAFGMSVRNFSSQEKYVQEGFELPLVFTLGISMDMMDLVPGAGDYHSLILSVDATHPRSDPEQLLIGMDYTFMKTLSIRGGYVTGSDVQKFSFGLGISKFGLDLDYACTPFEYFGNVQRFTLGFKF